MKQLRVQDLWFSRRARGRTSLTGFTCFSVSGPYGAKSWAYCDILQTSGLTFKGSGSISKAFSPAVQTSSTYFPWKARASRTSTPSF